MPQRSQRTSRPTTKLKDRTGDALDDVERRHFERVWNQAGCPPRVSGF